MKRGLAMALICLLALCGSAPAEEAATTDEIDISLRENRADGYTWSVTVSDDTVVAVLDNGTIADASSDTAAGMHTWAIIGRSPGSAKVVFTLSAEDGTAEATVGYAFAMDEDSRLTVTAVQGVPEVYMTGKAVVELRENGADGDAWDYQMSGEDVLVLTREAYDSGGEEAAVDAGGIRLWVFTAAAEGDVTLTYTYRRAGETEPEATVVYNFHVDAELNVTGSVGGADYEEYNADESAVAVE